MSCRIAILGATGHVARSLIDALCHDETLELYLFARDVARAEAFLDSLKQTELSARRKVLPLAAFGQEAFDVVINGIGIGSPQRLQNNLLSIFRLTEEFDNLILDYLLSNSEALYINLSSGAAYGADFFEAVTTDSKACFAANQLSTSEYYGIAKLHMEAKHRAASNLNIVDIRIFGFYSRYIDLEERFLLSEIIMAIKEQREFLTGPGRIYRDFSHPRDLAKLVRCCIQVGKINNVFDLYSRMPADKFEILDLFSQRYGLKYRIDDQFSAFAVTGSKNHYFSLNHRAESIGYIPSHSTISGIIDVTDHLLS